MKTNGALLLIVLVMILLLSLPGQAQGQGCGCEMPPPLNEEPHLYQAILPYVANGHFAELGTPPLPDKPVRPPVYLPIVGGAG